MSRNNKKQNNDDDDGKGRAAAQVVLHDSPEPASEAQSMSKEHVARFTKGVVLSKLGLHCHVLAAIRCNALKSLG